MWLKVVNDHLSRCLVDQRNFFLRWGGEKLYPILFSYMKTSFIVVHNGVPKSDPKSQNRTAFNEASFKALFWLNLSLDSEWKAPNYPIPVVTKQWSFRILQQANIAVQHFTAIILSRKKEKFNVLFIKEAFFKEVYQATTSIYICAKTITSQLLYQQTY